MQIAIRDVSGLILKRQIKFYKNWSFSLESSE